MLLDSQADLLVYGMGERATREIAARLASGTPVGEITDVKGTAFLARTPADCAYPRVECPSFEEVRDNKRQYAAANQIQYEEHDPIRGKAILQRGPGAHRQPPRHASQYGGAGFCGRAALRPGAPSHV